MTIQYEKRLVGFIDILGFKQHTEHAQKNNDIKPIKNCLDSIYQLLEEHYNKQQIQDVRVTTFSDSIIFSVPLDRVNLDNLFFSLLPLVWLQADMLMIYKVLMRGGLAYGDIYHNDKMVFGTAVNRAYELESQIAIYPRIVIDNSVLDFFNTHHKMLKNDQAWQNDWQQVQKLMKKDSDGINYVNYIEGSATEYEDNYPIFIQHVKQLVAEYQHRPVHIKQKYDWLLKDIPI